MKNKKYWRDNEPLSDFYKEKMAYLRTINTINEVEKLRCITCSNNGHWGWCDAPFISCPYKWRIKEILGKTESRYNSIKEQMPQLFT